MKKFLVPGFLVLAVICIFIIPACADNSPVNLSLSSVQEKGGFISANVTITPRLGEVLDEGYLTFWLTLPKGDCNTSRLLSWQLIALNNEPGNTLLKAPVPYNVSPGDYDLTIKFGPVKINPAACDMGPYARTTIHISTPGQGTRNMAAILTNGRGNKSEPDYRIESITGVNTKGRMAPYQTLGPSMTISNRGSDDTSGKPVEVHAYLGSDELIPGRATIEPMKAGERKIIQVAYIIPDTISERSYPFFMIIDPRGVHGTPDAASNLKRTDGLISVQYSKEEDHGCPCKKARPVTIP